jgi:hypothetical protein
MVMALNNFYPKTSPYAETEIYRNEFLDIWADRQIPKYSDDVYWEITSVYNWRPDLLAYDMYSDSKLWWVFAVRNPNVLKDPLFDFTSGTQIFLPKLTTLKEVLGI